MGNYTSSSKVYKNDEQELTVFGYIREETVNCYASIPVDVQRLCSEFYYQVLYPTNPEIIYMISIYNLLLGLVYVSYCWFIRMSTNGF